MGRRTVTNRTSRPRAQARTVPFLMRLFHYERPLDGGARHELDEVADVAIGRADEAQPVLRAKTSLTIPIDDERMSQKHARISRKGGNWVIEDQQSRNGTYVDGVRVEQASLVDGSVIELGRTALLFRIGPPAEVADRTASELVEILPGLETFSSAFATRLANAAKLARSEQSLVLHGETGTGKEVVARGIHQASGRSGPFVAVNCAALPPTLVESELFGFRKGAFSGASEDRPGLIRSADGGTLLLDEVGDLPLSTQAALLRVLQESEVLPIGATKAVRVDVRVLAASHRDLEAEVAADRFREDLLARLAGFVIDLPALRDRREDLGLLVAALLRGKHVRFSSEAARALVSYAWPRNVRELEQSLGSAVALADRGVVELEHLPPALHAKPATPTDDLAPSELRRKDELVALLETHKGNVAAVARAMGVARMQIHRWLERYRIDLDEIRK